MQPRVRDANTGSRSVRAFLSFTSRDAPMVEVFRARLGRQHPDIELLDHAVKDIYEEDWKRECATKIDRSELLICLLGATTHRSQAVAWEIDRGLSLGKRIVAIDLTPEGVRVPEILVRNAIEPQQSIADIVPWSAPTPTHSRGTNGGSG